MSAVHSTVPSDLYSPLPAAYIDCRQIELFSKGQIIIALMSFGSGMSDVIGELSPGNLLDLLTMSTSEAGAKLYNVMTSFCNSYGQKYYNSSWTCFSLPVILPSKRTVAFNRTMIPTFSDDWHS